MYTITVVYDKEGTEEMVKKTPSNLSPFLQFWNMNTREGKSKGYKLKSSWGARNNPFVLIEDGDIPIKAFYSEYDWQDNAVEKLLKWLKDD